VTQGVLELKACTLSNGRTRCRTSVQKFHDAFIKRLEVGPVGELCCGVGGASCQITLFVVERIVRVVLEAVMA
jgi:hypothetical protein